MLIAATSLRLINVSYTSSSSSSSLSSFIDITQQYNTAVVSKIVLNIAYVLQNKKHMIFISTSICPLKSNNNKKIKKYYRYSIKHNNKQRN